MSKPQLSQASLRRLVLADLDVAYVDPFYHTDDWFKENPILQPQANNAADADSGTSSDPTLAAINTVDEHDKGN